MADQSRQALEDLTQPLLESGVDAYGKNSSIITGL